MFKGSQNTNFKSDSPIEKVHEIIQENLQTLGSVQISDSGLIKINASRFDGFVHECEITGTVREKEGKYSLVLDWEAKPKWLIVIVIAVCTIGWGLPVLILPFIASNDMKKKASSALDNLSFELK